MSEIELQRSMNLNIARSADNQRAGTGSFPDVLLLEAMAVAFERSIATMGNRCHRSDENRKMSRCGPT